MNQLRKNMYGEACTRACIVACIGTTDTQKATTVVVPARKRAKKMNEKAEDIAIDATGPVWGEARGLSMVRVHSRAVCAGDVCTIHNPSDHVMREFPQLWRADRRIMERICPHEIGHPDPDDMAIRTGKDSGVHGCDGCCGMSLRR